MVPEPDEEQLAELLRLLPPVPEGLTRAAKELPRAREELDSIVQRAVADAAYRRRALADLEAALRETGIEPTPASLAALSERLGRLDPA